MSLEISGFTTNLIECQSTLSGDCCPIDPTLIVKPWAYQINTHGGADNCDFIVKRRPEKGWTLDFVFNRESQPWSNGGPFYFIGARMNIVRHSMRIITFHLDSPQMVG